MKRWLDKLGTTRKNGPQPDHVKSFREDQQKEGAFDYRVRPQSVEALMEVISQAWERQRSRREAARLEEVERIVTRRPA